MNQSIASKHYEAKRSLLLIIDMLYNQNKIESPTAKRLNDLVWEIDDNPYLLLADLEGEDIIVQIKGKSYKWILTKQAL